MRPGCKADYVPIFEGVQDKGKSTAIELLFTPWFSDDLAEFGSKDAAMQVRVAWGIEIGELASMGRADIDKVKAFITRKVDRFRPSYGRRVIEVPRQSIFVGSTNADTYLKDETGGRRFWPIRCDGKIDLDAIARDRDQFWAEAVALYKAATPWWFTDSEIITAAREQQAERYIEDPWQEPIAKFLALQDSVSTEEVLMSLGIDKSKWSRADQMRVGGCLKVMGWARYRAPPSSGRRPWRYRKA
jgi:predicted P-loop ATPase